MADKSKMNAKQDYAAVAEQLAAENAQLTEALQRERADAVNLRRRHDEQVASLRTAVKASVVKDLLPIVDNFERSLKHVPADLQSNDYIKGIEGIVKQFEKTLADLGVERIATKNAHFVIDHLRGKAVQRSESKHLNLTIETVLE
jgi:molecular chaperone GrpE